MKSKLFHAVESKAALLFYVFGVYTVTFGFTVFDYFFRPEQLYGVFFVIAIGASTFPLFLKYRHRI